MHIGGPICKQEMLYVNRRCYMYIWGPMESKVKFDEFNNSASLYTTL